MPDRAGVVLNRRDLDRPSLGPVGIEINERLLVWSETHLRDLPWRRTRDPWAVLVSEVMLQQTQVDRVAPKWREFLDRFPTAEACAGGDVGEVIALWQGLGYNRRAVNLWRAAAEVTERYGGNLPADLDGLRSLPGIGPYTARAVLAFAFERDVGVVDTNVGRLLARWTGQTMSPADAQALAESLTPSGRGWRWNQTLFDFATNTCTKRDPSCGDCPISDLCEWNADRSRPDPAAGSAGVSKPQSQFEGSRRQVRGRVVDALRHAPVPADELDRLLPAGSSWDVGAVLSDLVRDGLAEVVDGVVRLPRGRTDS